MNHAFKLSDISKFWHGKAKHPAHKHSSIKQVSHVSRTEDWDMSAEDALRVTYCGQK